MKIASSAKIVSHGHTKATVTPVVKPTAVAPAKPATSSVGFSVGGPVGASIGLIKQMESMNRAPANDMSSNEMFKNFGF
ncbi:phage lipoprotein [Salmonella enterica subsp. enterica serovar Enteritidis str. 629163]|nr:phage lipoprotein [Salmonella enterica subsp. enterica serovar Enteritidis str. 629163]